MLPYGVTVSGLTVLRENSRSTPLPYIVVDIRYTIFYPLFIHIFDKYLNVKNVYYKSGLCSMNIREEGHITLVFLLLEDHESFWGLLCDLRQEAQCGLCLLLVQHLISDEQDGMSLKHFVADSFVLALKVSWTHNCFSSMWDQCVGVSRHTAVIEWDPPKNEVPSCKENNKSCIH